ncbi:hypothetical protein [Clavibacter capsici]|uniref:hypothetical protein n=1 Tax=Clavibacter capsici TaxID=1874630 RepID=UPI0006B1CFC6|nr:hypothetical protein [Clavibacter capsici]ALD14322.1 hypothetical protein AES38_14545 [Clavibacter capsici]ALD14348.1 hypothetical protein AES38_14720 [Clavibacter capsici]
MTNLLPESPEEVNFLTALVTAMPPLLAIIIGAPIVRRVLFGKSKEPAERIRKIAKAWSRKP